MVHLPIWAVAQREAFVPTMAAFATQQPIDLQEPYKELAEALPPAKLWRAFIAAGPPLDPAVQKALARYDFVVFVDARPFALTHTIGLEPAYLGASLEIYRVTHQPEGAHSAKAPIL